MRYIVTLAAEIKLGMTQPPDADNLDVVASLARLEAALERIANASRVETHVTDASGANPAVSAMLADRLDAMIARLRAEIDRVPGES